MSHPVSSSCPETTSVAPVTTHTVWGSQGLEPGPVGLIWPKRCVSVLCAVTMPLGTTMGCGPVKGARPSLRGASRVGNLCASSIHMFVTDHILFYHSLVFRLYVEMIKYFLKFTYSLFHILCLILNVERTD